MEGNILAVVAIVIFAIVFLVLLLYGLAQARPSPQWASQPKVIVDWFESLMQPDNPSLSCCGEADGFEADTFEQQDGHWVAIITNGRGVFPNGKRVSIPDAKIKWDKGNPTGHGWVFLGSSGAVLCYVTPGGA